MSLKSRFASAVYHSRIERGLTQEEVAEALEISTRWYQHIEKGDVLPSSLLVLKIIAYFKIDGRQLAEDVYVTVQAH